MIYGMCLLIYEIMKYTEIFLKWIHKCDYSGVFNNSFKIILLLILDVIITLYYILTTKSEITVCNINKMYK